MFSLRVALIGLALSTLPAVAYTAKKKSFPVWDAAAINNPATPQPASLEETGNAVLRAQILLDRANFSAGELDGRQGKTLQRALRGFQSSRNLEASGSWNEQTWAALNADTEPALIPYRVTPEDLVGPFRPSAGDMMQQAKADALVFASAIEMLAERFHSSPKLLQELNKGKDFNKADEEILVPNIFTAPLPQAALIVVSEMEGTVTALDTNGKVFAQYPASIGSERDPLPIGEWKIKGVARNPPFHYNPRFFWDADPNHAKVKLPPGPNNPIGTVWIDLTKDHYGIHGTPDPSKIGYTQSHGCIRLTNWDANELAGAVKFNTPVSLRP